MNIKDITTTARNTWGNTPMSLEHIAVALQVIAGDIGRHARTKLEGEPIDDTALKTELGNIISSGIRWCDDLGFDPAECIALSQQAQTNYAAKHPPKW